MTAAHYDAAYFDWQRRIGRIGGWCNVHKFAPHIKSDDAVLDFGCGGGYVLSGLDCARRIGVEINPAARAEARHNGIEVYSTTAEVKTMVDVVISDHALEHALNPLGELRALYSVLKPRGTAVILIPCETIRWKYRPNDTNKHLFSWGPMTLGNLLTEAGFHVLDVHPTFHRKPPKALLMDRLLPRPLFQLAGRVWAHVKRDWIEIKAVAVKH